MDNGACVLEEALGDLFVCAVELVLSRSAHPALVVVDEPCSFEVEGAAYAGVAFAFGFVACEVA